MLEDTMHFVATGQQCFNTKYLLPGNIIPHFWYKKFQDDNGKPDLLAITIFSDLFAWVRNGTNDYFGEHMPKFDGASLSVSYDYFQEKFSFSKASIRRALVRLEEFSVLKRKTRNIELPSGIRVNRLFITIDQEFFSSCFRDPDLDIRVEYNNSYAEIKNTDIHTATDAILITPSLQICTDLIRNKNIKKDRSMKSNFLQNSFFKKEKGSLRVQRPYSPAPLQPKIPIRQLKDFYPLSANDAGHLQSTCGREFSLNAMNEILLDMSKRVKDRWFKDKRRFLNYMSKVFKNEMRDAVKISGKNFRIRANQTTEEITIQQQEKFLSQIEYSLQVSPEWHLKKKLCSVLAREKAYNLLSCYKYCHLEKDTFEIHLTKQVNLTSQDRNIILNQVKASHNSVDLATGNFINVSSLKIVMPATVTKPSLTQPVGKGTVFQAGIWGNVRQVLINYYGKDGEALDKSWFSQLTPEVDEQKKTIKLKAPTEFIKDWINRNYAQVLETNLKKHQYSCMIC